MTTERRRRTADVRATANSFSALLLPEWLLKGLDDAGFEQPSPIQQAAIPLARYGADLVVQAKSGTGKTAVFGVTAAEMVDVTIQSPQVLVVAPTREIAFQIGEVIAAVGAHRPPAGVAVGVFIGGLPTEEDHRRLRRTCHVAVGTPGRLCALIADGKLPIDRVKVLVLDEADRLMAHPFNDDVEWILGVLPAKKQVLAFSATYTPQLLERVERLMEQPQRVMLAAGSTSLLGVRQFYCLTSDEGGEIFAAKASGLLKLLSKVSFHQAVVFCNQQEEASWLASHLTSLGFPAAFICGSQTQVERMDIISGMRDFKLRLVVSTDLLARGLDLERVNLVVNLDLPKDEATYMHRVGRTGRFGTFGIAVTFVTPPEQALLQGYLQGVAGGQVDPLPDFIPDDYYTYALPTTHEQEALKDLLRPATPSKSGNGAGAEVRPATPSKSGNGVGAGLLSSISGNGVSAGIRPPTPSKSGNGLGAGMRRSTTISNPGDDTDSSSGDDGRVVTSDGEDLGPRIDWLADLPVNNPWGRQTQSTPSRELSQEAGVRKEAPSGEVPTHAPSQEEDVEGGQGGAAEFVGDIGFAGGGVNAVGFSQEESVEGGTMGAGGVGVGRRARKRGGSRRAGSEGERAERAGLSLGEIEELDLEEAILAIHAAAAASSSEDEQDSGDGVPLGFAPVGSSEEGQAINGGGVPIGFPCVDSSEGGQGIGRGVPVHFAGDSEPREWQSSYPPSAPTAVGSYQGASSSAPLPPFLCPGYQGFGHTLGNFTYPGPPPGFTAPNQAMGANGYPGVYTPSFPAPSQATSSGYPGVYTPAFPPPTQVTSPGGPPPSEQRPEVVGDQRGPAPGAGTPSVEEEYVRVPVALLRRYYELEWEAGMRRYKEWQEMYSSYQYYYGYYGGGGYTANPQPPSDNNTPGC